MIATDGRRERKKAETRTRIREAALDLFASQGYRETTIAQIAARADVATRTVTLHFPAKDDLLFADDPFTPESLEERLRARTAESTLDAVGDWMHATMRELDARDHDSGADPAHLWQRRALRAGLLMADDDLRGRARAGYRDLELLIAAGIGADLGLPADALLPRLAAVTVVTGLREIYVTREGRTRSAASELSDLVDEVLAFARAGLRDRSAAPDPRGSAVRDE
ncbi:TetR family transcriptional regulator [Amycolatopsis mediterranei S699]|uniref:TetR family transcriptional regulator n=2 Tax=Amycolatopsis mediterranei TaxID=33910 RepID=A0A0H3D3I8_AMYMU|nr:TetR/AcrR family transcriptional regulator [Amycolatopsis mediterranei]ADJ44737.1 TetR family transcriptional regulator [Amycolatopsis mediterranei U32]AEK41482.1 TetR family transcriptional regulator [Amycolatopsis mediterranei S699]AFO76448.1 TetR family transcriptional regulator [Amycolatopsis mediterranei S699]AGT83577.1 TetR family transcriptional regulator [Amycolatopsis mediterranei RB]KDO07439.1 TetR family transcriptional regulator [Amycolatopsis mediterranei]